MQAEAKLHRTQNLTQRIEFILPIFLHASNKLCAKDKHKNLLGESGFHEKRRSKATIDIGDSMNLCPYFPHFYDW
jgi:hypothetical protein